MEVGDAEVHGAAASHVRVAAPDDRLEALDVKARRVAVLAPVGEHRVDQLARPRQERLALAPVGAHVVEIGRNDPLRFARQVRDEAVAAVGGVHALQVVAEDHLLGGARAVQVHDVA